MTVYINMRAMQHGHLSESLAILAVVLVVEHTEVGVVPAFRDVMLFQGLPYGTSRFVGMCAVVETAVF